MVKDYDDDFVKPLSDMESLAKDLGVNLSAGAPSLYAKELERFQKLSVPKPTLSPAEWTYERLVKYINEFESDLNQDQEVGVRLVSFGASISFHIENLGYFGPDIITFFGTMDDGKPVQLIQNISQLSVLLMAVEKCGETARRIGFELLNKAEETSEDEQGEVS